MIRGVSFEAAAACIEEGYILAAANGKGKYAHQKQYILWINRYVYIVPYVEDEKTIFLKTVIPSRKLTKKFLGGPDDER